MKRFLLISTVVAVLAVALAITGVANSQSGNTWTMNFYSNSDWAGAPSYVQYSSNINFNWGNGSPSPSVPVDNFTGTFTTSAYFYAGQYRFSATADDEVSLIIDGVTYINTIGAGQSGKTQQVTIAMGQGWHNLQVNYREFTQAAYVYVDWVPTKNGTPVPATPPPSGGSCPYPTPPASAPSVTTKYGDYTPCIQNGSHQSKCYQTDGAWNSPNLGSIEMEPQITIWGNCEPPDSDETWVTDCTTDPPKTQGYRCSKTLAGWFPS